VEILPAADWRPAVSPGSWSAPIGNPAAWERVEILPAAVSPWSWSAPIGNPAA
jgi:hypothetical protein